MNIDETLDNVRSLCIETAPFIYFVERNPVYLDRIRDIFRRVHRGEFQVMTSVITLTEVLVMPIRLGQADYEREYREMLLNTDHILTVPVSAAIAEHAAHIRAQHNLRTPDAIHIAKRLCPAAIRS
jgi:predicted nucleic acid-binding protein